MVVANTRSEDGDSNSWSALSFGSDDEWHRLLGAWGPDTEVLDRLGGGLRGDVRQVRIDRRLAVGRLSARSRSSLDWELDLLQRLNGAELRVPSVLLTGTGARRNDYMVVTEWIAARPATASDDARRARYLRGLHELTRGWKQRPGCRTARELVYMDSAGDIDMSQLPETVATACRLAWDGLPAGPLGVVHGDLDAENCLVAYDGNVVMVDWGAARVDHPWFDLAPLSVEASGLTEKQYRIARRASCAWEVALHWPSDESYARQRLREMVRLATA